MTDLISEVKKRIEDDDFKALLLSTLAKSRLIRESIDVIRHYRIKTAISLLESGMRRSEVVQALITRLGVSRKTAYNIINAAINSKNSIGKDKQDVT